MDDSDAHDRRNDGPLRDPTDATPPDAEPRREEPAGADRTGADRTGAGGPGAGRPGADRPGADRMGGDPTGAAPRGADPTGARTPGAATSDRPPGAEARGAEATGAGATGAGATGAPPPGAEPRDADATAARPRSLRRSRHDRIISGLSGGLGTFFGVDPTLFRIGFVLLAFAGGGGIILYLIMTLVVPSEGDPAAGTSETMRRGAEDLADSVKHVTDGLRTGENDRSRNVAAIVLILLGAFFLFRNLDWLNWFDAGWVWPVLLIGLGLWLLARRR